MGQVLCFHVTSAQKAQFTGEGNSVKNHLKKLRGRETIYLVGLEAVGITSANVPICVAPILSRVVHIRSCKGKQGEEPKHGGYVRGNLDRDHVVIRTSGWHLARLAA